MLSVKLKIITIKTTLNLLLLVFAVLSCSGKKNNLNNKVPLYATDKMKSFNLDSDTKYNAFYLYPFSDSVGKEYLSFLNYSSNQVLFYDLKSCNFLFKINMPAEGPDGIVQPSGYYIKDLDNIYLTSYAYSGLIQVDTASHIIKRIPYGKTDSGFKFLPSYVLSSHPYTIPYSIGGRIHLMPPLVERFCPADKTPLCVSIDTVSSQFVASEITYSDVLSEEELAANDTRCSRVFDGKTFIYSFYVDEDIIIADKDHKEFRRIKSASQYIKSPVEKQKQGVKGPQSNLEVARYGDLIYDKYRKVYYRFAYPQVELDDKINWRGKAVYGRKKFSVIILDEQFNRLGETLFPESIYNSYVFFVNKDGLYISRDYQVGIGNQSEDFMTFELFELK